MLATVTYDRKQKVYRVEDETFPAGRNGRRDAFRYAVHATSPRLFRFVSEMSQKYPTLESRAWRAAEIVLNDGVCLNNGQPATVASQSSEYGDYLIHNIAGALACDCLDFQGGTAVYISTHDQPYCKHILAYQLALRLTKRRCYHCQTLVDKDAEMCPHCQQEVTPF